MAQSSLLTLSSLTTEYIRVRVQYTSAPSLGSDPTLLSVQMAFKEPDVVPINADFVAAEWRVEDTKLYILCLVGSTVDAVIDLPAGFYNVWIKIVGDPEVIVRMAGSVTIE